MSITRSGKENFTASQAKGDLAPWEGHPELQFVGEVRINGALLSADRIRFYRLTRPPADLRSGSAEQAEPPGTLP